MIRNYIEKSGQRNSVLIDPETRLPSFWPTLYVSSALRTKGASHSTVRSHLYAISCLYTWASMRKLDPEERIYSGRGFTRNEIDSLITLLRSRLRDYPLLLRPSSNVEKLTAARHKTSDIWRELEEQPRQINPSTFNDRLNYIGRYVEWLSDYLSDQDTQSPQEARDRTAKIGTDFKKVLSDSKSIEPNTHFESPKSISNKDVKSILTILHPNHHLNPWTSIDVRIRNLAIIYILLDTGLRTGELLSLKLQDIIFGKKYSRGLRVRRRQGSRDDPRVIQPSTKRDEREVPLSEAAFKILDLYVTSVRNKICNSSSTEYIFLSSGNRNNGAPLSSITPITNKIREATGIDLEPHKLRHTATWKFCVSKKKQGKQWDEFSEHLSMKFGWRSVESPMVRHYAKRFLRDELFEQAIIDQEKISAEMDAAVEALKQELDHEQ